MTRRKQSPEFIEKRIAPIRGRKQSSEHVRKRIESSMKTKGVNTHCQKGHEFTPENTVRDYRDNSRSCRKCRNAGIAIWRKKTDRHFISRLRIQFGITPDQYYAMLEKQNGVCAICGFPPNARMKLAIDHCHVTNTLRGLLHNGCNSALGLLGDTSERVMQAVRYLRESEGPGQRMTFADFAEAVG